MADSVVLFSCSLLGYITTSDIQVAIRSWGINMTEENMAKLLRDYDRKKTGKISYQKYLTIMEKYMTVPGCVRDVIMEAFGVFDKDKKGKVNYQEVKHVLTKMGEFLSPQIVEKIFKDNAEVDRDGNFDYAAFVDNVNNLYQVFDNELY